MTECCDPMKNATVANCDGGVEWAWKSAVKPGSVEASHVSGGPGQSFLWEPRCRDPLAAYPGAARATPLLPYLALPRMGFAVPVLLPVPR
jgi:hypothetical protein